ncbi:MAG: hypothetical protein JW751_02345 [Polyangiaceae bacterium]|nr:hypothetical protein [Polyangiaceae bacterium]
MIKARTKTRPGRQWRVGREHDRRLKAAFDARDIEIPFPYVIVVPGRDKASAVVATVVGKADESR